MSVTSAAPVSSVRVGEPITYGSLAVFPLYNESISEAQYRLSDEALADGTVSVEELTEGGSVPQLMVRNRGDQPVLFLEGEQLIGAKQNRVLNTSVLVAAHTDLQVPVSCVEQGRWRYVSRQFRHSGMHSPSRIRRAVKESVSVACKAGSHHSDQRRVWAEVTSLATTHQVDSETMAMSDCFDQRQDRLEEFRKNVAYATDASGMAIAVGDKLMVLDVFDKPKTCQRVWERLLTGYVLDALERPDAPATVSAEAIKQLLEQLEKVTWSATTTVGQGQEYRAETPAGDHASALTVDDTLIHGSVVLKA